MAKTVGKIRPLTGTDRPIKKKEEKQFGKGGKMSSKKKC